MLDKESETYVSAIGCLDTRVDLDIKPDDIRYFPVLSAMASKVVYENRKFVEAVVKGQWKVDLPKINLIFDSLLCDKYKIKRNK